jgi:hypothetical protein
VSFCLQNDGGVQRFLQHKFSVIIVGATIGRPLIGNIVFLNKIGEKGKLGSAGVQCTPLHNPRNGTLKKILKLFFFKLPKSVQFFPVLELLVKGVVFLCIFRRGRF